MPKAVSVIFSLSLSPFLAAQDKTTTSPPGWETAEGPARGAYFGWWKDARYQFIDVEFVGAGVKSIKQVG